MKAISDLPVLTSTTFPHNPNSILVLWTAKNPFEDEYHEQYESIDELLKELPELGESLKGKSL